MIPQTINNNKQKEKISNMLIEKRLKQINTQRQNKYSFVGKVILTGFLFSLTIGSFYTAYNQSVITTHF